LRIGKNIEKTIRSTIIHLTETASDSGDGGKQEEEVERFVAEDLLKH